MKNNKSTLYIDESGKSSLIEEKEPFIITGTIIRDAEVTAIEGYFTYIKRKFGIDEHCPFHSYHIFEEPKTKLSDTTLVKLANSLAEFINLIPVQVQVLTVDKKSFRKAIGVKSDSDFKGDKKKKEIKEYPYRVMASALFAWFSEYLESNEHIGQVIADSRRGGDHQLLKTLNLCREGHVPYIQPKTTTQIKERITALCFSEKNFLSGGLELTDLISYVTYFKVRRLVSKNKDIGIDILWEAVRNQSEFSLVEVDENAVRRFFGLKKDEVHKYLK